MAVPLMTLVKILACAVFDHGVTSGSAKPAAMALRADRYADICARNIRLRKLQSPCR